jgi:hypothetical protein
VDPWAPHEAGETEERGEEEEEKPKGLKKKGGNKAPCCRAEQSALGTSFGNFQKRREGRPGRGSAGCCCCV